MIPRAPLLAEHAQLVSGSMRARRVLGKDLQHRDQQLLQLEQARREEQLVEHARDCDSGHV